MNVRDITLTIIILLTFIILYLAPLLSIGIQNIKNNWVKYRCNPMVMPFAGFFGEDPSTTFSFCIQSLLKDFMKIILIPIQQSLSVIGSLGGDFQTAINDVRKVMDAIRNFITEIIQTVFGVFLNIMIEIQKLILRTKDVLGKFLGIMTSLLFIMEGSIDTMQAGWAGPPGQLVRALCFDPKTKIRLRDGGLREIQKIKLGDVLKNGDVVEGVIQLKNTNADGTIREKFYCFPNGGEDRRHIRVTGSHMVFHKEKVIPVREHPAAVPLDESYSTPILYCLRTSTQRIPIGKYNFWDWDDDEVAKK
jgi:hypothetical protein